MAIAVVVVAGAFYGLYSFQAFKEKMIAQAVAQQQAGGATITISAEEAKAENWHAYLVSVGNLESVQGVDLAPEVAGVVTGVNFSSGQDVRAGTLLVEINDSVEKAVLKGGQAAAQESRKQFERYQVLAQRGDQSQASLDQQRSVWQQAAASVEQTEAQIAQKNILAPFDGRLGIRRVNLGQYVGPGQVLVTLQDLDNLYVNFSMPAQFISQLAIGLEVDVTTNAYPGETFKASLTSLDAVVDQNTRNISVQGTMTNPGRKLLPGMFVNVRVLLPQIQNVVAVPETAVTYSLFGDSVYVVVAASEYEKTADGGTDAAAPGVAPDQKVVKQVFVQVGSRRNGEVAILHGVNAGDMVVTSGQTKLRDGVPVNINNAVTLGPRTTIPRG